MELLLQSLGFLSPFTSSLPLFILVGLLVINPVISAHWACSLFLYPFFLLTFSIVGFLLLLGPLLKMGINNIYVMIFNN